MLIKKAVPIFVMSSVESGMQQELGGVVLHLISRVLKKNADTMMQIDKQVKDIFREHGVLRYEVFQLSNTDVPMEGFTNIAKIVSANQDEEVWVESLYFRDHQHLGEVMTKIQNDERMTSLMKQCMNLMSPGTSYITGEFNRLKV
jgi:uncharacterized protein YbaA (DUF1428 family)